ncbi:MAG: TetR/AcrR family transcriptional regulator [Pseudomonadota bacterium]
MATHESAAVRRAQILDAALQCFGEKGFSRAKMDDIVQASGLSKGAIYWHFKSKDEIFLALFDTYAESIFEAWQQVETNSTLEQLYLQGDIVLRQILETRELLDTWVEFFGHPAVRERFAEVYQQSRTELAKLIQVGIAQGEIQTCEPTHIASALTALIEGLLLQVLVDAEYDVLAAWPEAWRIFSAGLTAK